MWWVKGKSAGFSLMELMVAVAIVGILSAIAYPSYRESVAKARRNDAAGALLEGAQALERYFSVNGRYINGSNQLPAVFPPQVPANGSAHYTIAATGTPTANTFTLRATRGGAMADDACGDFQIDQAGTLSLNAAATGKTVADCWRR